MAEQYKIDLGIGLNDSDFQQIKKQIEGLSSNSIKIKLDVDNSIKAIIPSIEKQMQQGGMNAGNSFAKSFNDSIKIVSNNSSIAIGNMRKTLKNMKFDDSSIKTVTKDLTKMNLEISNISTKINGNSLRMSVKGIDELGRAITIVKDFDASTGKVENVGRTIAQSFDTSVDAAKRFQKEVNAAFSELAKKQDKIGKLELELEGLDPEKNARRINNIKSQISDLKSEYNELLAVFGTHFSNDQWSKIEKNAVDAANKISLLQDKLADTSDINKQTEAFDKLKSKAQEISKLKIEIAGLDVNKNANEIETLTTKLNRLESECNDLYVTTSKDLSDNQIKELGQIAENTTVKVKDLQEQLSSKKADTVAIDRQTKAYKDLKEIVDEIKKIDPKFHALDSTKNASEVELLSNKLTELKNDYNTLKEVFKGQVSSEQFGNLQAELDETEFKISQVEAKLKDAKNNLAKKLKIDIDIGGDIKKKVDNINTEFKSLSGASEQLTSDVKELNGLFAAMQTASAVDDVDALEKSYIQLETVLKRVKNQINDTNKAEQSAYDIEVFNREKEKAQLRLNGLFSAGSEAAQVYGREAKELAVRLNECGNIKGIRLVTKDIENLGTKIKQSGLATKTWTESLQAQFQKFSSYFSVATLFMYAERGLQDMFEQVKLIDSAMTELKKVTDETDATYNQFLGNAAERAKKIGTTIDGLVDSTAEFAKIGYSFEDSQGLAEVANIYKLVGDNIESAEVATESLISTMAAFKDEMNGMDNTDFAMSIVDKFNEVDILLAS